MIMKNENNFLFVNKTWFLTNTFKDKRVFRDKWVYKIKKNKHNEILRYKTRWIVRDFEQIEELNYTKIFASMMKLMNYKIMYVIVIVNDWKIEQINVKTKRAEKTFRIALSFRFFRLVKFVNDKWHEKPHRS